MQEDSAEQVVEFPHQDNRLEMEDDDNNHQTLNTSSLQNNSNNDDAGDIPSPNISLLHENSTNDFLITEIDLDKFFRNLYTYFYEKGFFNLFLSRFLQLVTVLFIIAVSSLMALFFNWSDVFSCKQEACKNVAILTLPRSFSLFYVIAMLFELVFFAYWCTLFYQYVHEVQSMLKVKDYLRKLQVTEDDMQTITWNELIAKFTAIQEEFNITRLKMKIDEKTIANLIMRKENYLIALLNAKILNLQLPIFKTAPLVTESLVWNLRYLIDKFFDQTYHLDVNYLHKASNLRNAFFILGILNLLAAPFLFIYILIKLFIEYTAAVKSGTLGIVTDLKWTTLAKWEFREFNELPHIFDTRMKLAAEPMQRYFAQFPTFSLSLVGTLVSFLASGFAAIIILLTAVKSDLLIHIQFLDQNLIWWLSIFTLIYLNAKNVIISEFSTFDPSGALKSAAAHIHYYPEKWKTQAHHASVKAQVSSFFQMSVLIAVTELLSIFITPILLCISLPICAEEIATFVEANTISMDVNDPMSELGDICTFGTFAIEQFGTNSGQHQQQNEGREEGNNKNGQVHKSGNHQHQHHQQGMSMKKMKKLKRTASKMEQSLLSFAAHNPNWKPGKQQEEFIKKISDSIVAEDTYAPSAPLKQQILNKSVASAPPEIVISGGQLNEKEEKQKKQQQELAKSNNNNGQQQQLQNNAYVPLAIAGLEHATMSPQMLSESAANNMFNSGQRNVYLPGSMMENSHRLFMSLLKESK